MAEPEDLENVMPTPEVDGETKDGIQKAKVEKKARLNAEKALAEAQEALLVTKREIEQERQARIKAEKTLAEAEEILAATQSKLKQERETPEMADKSGT